MSMCRAPLTLPTSVDWPPNCPDSVPLMGLCRSRGSAGGAAHGLEEEDEGLVDVDNEADDAKVAGGAKGKARG
eukprot:8420900-Pyramimonas_sp.AAC.1